MLFINFGLSELNALCIAKNPPKPVAMQLHEKFLARSNLAIHYMKVTVNIVIQS